jgi:hypothetical protein
MKTDRPTLSGIIFLIIWGLIFFSFGAWCLICQRLPFRSGQSTTKIITPDEHPIFFWAAVAFCLGAGGFGIYRAIAESIAWRHNRRELRR